MAHKKHGGHHEHGEKIMHHTHEMAKKAHHGHHSHMGKGHAPSEGFVEGHDEMVGKRDYAGMPPEVKMSLYPKSKEQRDEHIDDTMSDVDSIHSMSEGQRRKYLSTQK